MDTKLPLRASAAGIDRQTVEGLIRLSLRGLEQMFEPRDGLLYVRRLTAAGEVWENLLAARDTIMTSLGVADARAAGYETTLEAPRLLAAGLARAAPDALGDQAMALWANAVMVSTGRGADQGAGREAELLPRVLEGVYRPRALERGIGRVLAWTLLGLTRHHELLGDVAAAEAARYVHGYVVARLWSASGQLFFHSDRTNPLERVFSLFSTQIYLLYAMAEYFRVFRERRTLAIAEALARRLLALQDRRGAWPWRYDARSGRVIERYPVYSVHQDAMGPMAFQALSRANGAAFGRVYRKSLAWLGDNELGVSMVDERRSFIHRAIRRQALAREAFEYLGKWAALASGGRVGLNVGPALLEHNPTCRPYHLGWILHAWCGKLDTLE